MVCSRSSRGKRRHRKAPRWSRKASPCGTHSHEIRTGLPVLSVIGIAIHRAPEQAAQLWSRRRDSVCEAWYLSCRRCNRSASQLLGRNYTLSEFGGTSIFGGGAELRASCVKPGISDDVR